MKMDRRGITALPIKLLIITTIVALSLPMIMDAVDTNDDMINTEHMESESRKIVNAATATYYSMNGATKIIEISVPEDCTMILGGYGDDAYGIHMYCGTELMSQQWFEKPILSFTNISVISDDCVLSITTMDKRIEVTAL